MGDEYRETVLGLNKQVIAQIIYDLKTHHSYFRSYHQHRWRTYIAFFKVFTLECWLIIFLNIGQTFVAFNGATKIVALENRAS